jgi:hypothetical protein
VRIRKSSINKGVIYIHKEEKYVRMKKVGEEQKKRFLGERAFLGFELRVWSLVDRHSTT